MSTSDDDASIRDRILDLVDDGHRDQVATLLDQYHNESVAEENRAYRDLADAVDVLLRATVDNPNAAPWDGDESELEILERFLHWVTDLVAHNLARRLRAEHNMAPKALQAGMKAAAESVEPFELTEGVRGDRFWVRKRDDMPAPIPSPDDTVQQVTVSVPGRVASGLVAQSALDSTTEHGRRLLAAIQAAPRNRYGRGERVMVTEEPAILEKLATVIDEVSASGATGEGGVIARFGFAPIEGRRTTEGIRAKLAR